MTPTEAITEFLTHERSLMDVSLLITELRRLGDHSGGVWPVVNETDWRLLISAMITSGRIVDGGRGLKLRWDSQPVEAVKTTKSKRTKNKDQGELF